MSVDGPEQKYIGRDTLYYARMHSHRSVDPRHWGAGFIGSHLARAVTGDSTVHILDNLTTGRRKNVPSGATLHEADIRDDAAWPQSLDLIFHEAALVSVAESTENPTTSHEINVDATLSLLEQARTQETRVVLASSAAIYGHPNETPISESHSKEPTSPYGLDKLTIDHYARLYSRLYDLETIALRYFNVYGPGQVAGDYSGVISVFVDQALSGEDITVYGDGQQTRISSSSTMLSRPTATPQPLTQSAKRTISALASRSPSVN